MAIPITSRKHDRIVYPNEILLPEGKFGLGKESIASCHQIRTIDKKRLSKNMSKFQIKIFETKLLMPYVFSLGLAKIEAPEF
jgi:mRNA interferase MazF